MDREGRLFRVTTQRVVFLHELHAGLLFSVHLAAGDSETSTSYLIGTNKAPNCRDGSDDVVLMIKTVY